MTKTTRICLYAVVAVLGVVLATPAFADDVTDRLDALERENADLRARMDRFTSVRRADPCARAYLPEAHCPSPCDPPAFRVFADLLYWTVDTNADYVEVFDISSPPNLLIDTKSVAVDGFSPGFRVGAGYRFCGGWDLTAAWTHWEGDGDDSTSPGTDQLLLPIGPVPPGPDQPVASEIDVALDLFTLDVGRSFMITPCVAGRAFLGLMYADVEREVTTTAFTGTAAPLPAVSTEEFDFSGFGLRLGGDLEYCFGCGFSAFASGSIGFLYGDAEGSAVAGGEQTPTTSFSDDATGQVVPVFQLAAGLAWNTKLGCVCLRAALGYEFLSFQDLEVSRFGGGDKEKVDFNFHGPTLRLQLDF